jgi:hypothetical protein
VIFNSAGGCRRHRTTISPAGTGLQTNLFGRTRGTSVITPGDSVGFYQGRIAVTLGSGVPVIHSGDVTTQWVIATAVGFLCPQYRRFNSGDI